MNSTIFAGLDVLKATVFEAVAEGTRDGEVRLREARSEGERSIPTQTGVRYTVFKPQRRKRPCSGPSFRVPLRRESHCRTTLRDIG